MSFAPRVSVVVVSRDRPEALKLCLTALRYLDYPSFEVIVAADDVGLAAVAQLPFAEAIKTAHVPERGIAAARNAGIAQAAGEVVAFIDDDAVAEPTWLSRLIAPFADPQVQAAGGYVLGRNGISYQWRGRTVDACAQHADLPVAEGGQVFAPPPGQAIKTEGTNMAFRRDTLVALGGFDPGYVYYLDETDLNMRLAQTGAQTAIVPGALVHHGFAPSAWRRANRAPRSLVDIGASTARFLARFAPSAAQEAARARLRRDQRNRLLRHMVGGTLEPGAIAPLMRGLEQGLQQPVTTAPLPPLALAEAPFRPFASFPPAPAVWLSGRSWSATRLRARAAENARAGRVTTLFLLSPTALYHHHRFHPGGWWEQRGGLFGRAQRDRRLIEFYAFSDRVAAEQARVENARTPR